MLMFTDRKGNVYVPGHAVASHFFTYVVLALPSRCINILGVALGVFNHSLLPGWGVACLSILSDEVEPFSQSSPRVRGRCYSEFVKHVMSLREGGPGMLFCM